MRVAWSLTPVRIPVPGEGHMVANSRSYSCAAWSLTPVRVPVPGEGHMVSHSFVF